jgi:hypothetical protein
VVGALTKLVSALAAGEADGTSATAGEADGTSATAGKAGGTVALVEACVKAITEALDTGLTEGDLNDVRSGYALLLHIHYAL